MEQEVKNCKDCPFYSCDSDYGSSCSQGANVEDMWMLDIEVATDCPLKEKPITVKLKTK